MQNTVRHNLAVWGLVITLAVVLALSAVFVGVAKAIGENPIENYVPVVKLNEGLYTALPITTTSGLTAASIINSGAFTQTGSATFAGNVTLGDASTDTVTVTGEATFSGGTTTFSGVKHFSQSQAFDTATTTVCSLQSPNATSSLLLNGGTGATWSVGSTSAWTATFARATTAFATTTQIGETVAVAAGAQATIVASSTALQAAANAPVFAPNTWLNISMSGGTGTFSPTGNCWATFVTAN